MTDMTDMINSPNYHRNIEPIQHIVLSELPAGKTRVLEIGSGSGQHTTALAIQAPDATFLPSDPDPDHRASITSWAHHLGTNNVNSPIAINADSDTWFGNEDEKYKSDFDILLCFNVIHITPFEVTKGLVTGASKYLKHGGKLILYGPYKVDGEHTAPSNQRFDQSLRMRNSSWGVRNIGDIEALGKNHGLDLKSFNPVPANNFMPVFIKQL